MPILHCDFESYSAADLPVCGLDNYAKHPTTGVHCMAFAFDDLQVGIWLPAEQDPDSKVAKYVLSEHVAKGGLVYAHNAAFELAIWNNVCVPKYGWPALKPEQVRCTMAMAYAMSLPGSLEKASAALGIEQRKDMAGSRVMMQLAKPKDDGTFWKQADDPEKFEKLFSYCRTDVEVERALHKRMMELSDYEQKIWQIDQRINGRGVQVDLEAVNAAIKLVESEKARLDGEMLRVTEGNVGKCTEVQLLVKWIKTQGVDIKGVAKSDVLDAMSGNLPDRVRAALALRREAAKSSTAKLIAMRDAASADGRVRGILQYHGANTGRWAGRRIQVQNFPRTRKGIKPKHVEDILGHLHDRDYIDIMYGPVLDALADSLRGMICAASGNELVSADYSNIEGRVLAWLAGEEWKLQAFREFDVGRGPDIYKLSYAKSFNVRPEDVDDDQRQIGKVQDLSMGFAGGKGAFQNMARIYGVKVSDDEAEKFKTAWREAHPRIVNYWHDHESAAINAVQLGCVCKAGPAGRQIAYKKEGSFLWCRLPSGRVLCYPYPTVRDIEVPWGGTKPALFFWTVNGTTNKWEETSTYGGDLAQSVTQAAARDIMADAMPRLESAGYPIVFHVHDQCIVETTSDNAATAVAEVEGIMADTPEWARGLPVVAEGWHAKRFRK